MSEKPRRDEISQPGANDPYKSLSPEAWDAPNNNISRPFERPESGRIRHLRDEVMKVFRVK
ncbi:site-specific DNA-methyltransferase [Desulfonema ishimotonii]|uniref:Site-specific DNA-methyltransferase n=1 Tax=Desulfonema ishimotonii TaxID=45657 RepID=A0A401FXU1_9BACT|nr:hypothetical protein [Desulfonema ishimotonii]GBC61776.1 site-specific DNA-methyltransferase [Desulfonema ishimotonii]